MARRSNPLFIGKEYLNKEGRMIKHPALIKIYGETNANKINDEKLELIGLDLETNHLTGELKLLGAYDNDEYFHYTGKFISVIYSWLTYAKNKQKALCYWNRLDPFVLYRTILSYLPEEEHRKSMERFAKVSGEWNRDKQDWDVKPVVQLDLGDGVTMGIVNVIRSSIQFFYKRPQDEEINRVWAYDIAQLYENGLQQECLGTFDEETKSYPYARFDWYSKVDESVHKVDWERFETDSDFRELVLYSNKLDARACLELGYSIQKDFKNAFGFYPRTLISQGSLARAAITAMITNMLTPNYSDEKELRKAVVQELKSIGILNYLDDWADYYGKDFVKDFYALLTESYSGGYIESIRYGYSETGWYADIASAYPAIIAQLYDLRGCNIIKGTGTPPDFKHSYVFIRGTVNIPDNVNYHPITIKHWHYKETNIRAVGTYKASYIKEERDFLIELGATFENETWYAIQTTGEKSVLANVTEKFISLRKKLQKENNSAQYMAKIAANSEYGILFEAVPTHEENRIEKQITHDNNPYGDMLKQFKKSINLNSIKKDLKYYFDDQYASIMSKWHNKDSKITPEDVKNELETRGIFLKSDHPTDIIFELNDLENYKHKSIEKYDELEIINAGYRAGEFWNPIYASIITAKTRLMLAKAAHAIESKGGKPIILMTDSITWQGSKDMLPPEMVKEVKTLGYFETPQFVKDVVCLGTGRYGFYIQNKKGKWVYASKRRGLNVQDLHDENGIALDEFNWMSLLKKMQRENKTEIDISVRTLISVGMIIHRNDLNVSHLGRIVKEHRTVQAIVGKNKRIFDNKYDDPHILAKTLVDTMPIEYVAGMFGKYEIEDQTLPLLRYEMMKKEYLTSKEREKDNTNKRAKRFYHRNKEEILTNKKENYRMLKDLGYTTDDAMRMMHWSNARIEIYLKDEGLK